MAVLSKSVEEQLQGIRPGDDIFFLYEDSAECIAFAAAFLKNGLLEGERCVCISDVLERVELIKALAADGVDVPRELERGALACVDAREFYPMPLADPKLMARTLHRKAQEARADGFTGFRYAAEMAWTRQSAMSDEDLVEFASRVQEAAGIGAPTVAACYGIGRADPILLRKLISVSQRVIARDEPFARLSSLFHGLPEPELKDFLRSAGTRSVARGGFYFLEGDPTTELYILTSGKVKLFRTAPDGRNTALYVVRPTETFGFSPPDWLGQRGRRATSAEVLEDSRALMWPFERLVQAMMKHHAIMLNAMRLIAERYDAVTHQLQNLSEPSVEIRLARIVVALAQSMGHTTPRGIVVKAPLPGRVLAEMTGTSSYTVSRILSAWRRQQVVDAGRGRILIHDAKRLAQLAGMAAGEERKAGR